MTTSQTRPPRSLFPVKYLFPLTIALIFGLGLAARLYQIDQAPFEFHPTRQFYSALKARGMYYQALPDAPAWKRDLAVRQWQSDVELEPPLLEHLVVFTYRFTGEELWVARVYSIVFWLIGGLFLFLLAQKLTSPAGGAVSLAFYLLSPYGVAASRTFQPDALMMMLIILFWWIMERWGRNPTWLLTILAGLAGGLSILVKFPAVFFVVGGALGVIFAFTTFRQTLRLPQTWLMVVLGILPAGMYTVNGILHGTLSDEFANRILPQLLLDPFFYIRWFNKAVMVVDVVIIAIALLSTFVFANRVTRHLFIGLWAGYLGLGLVLTHHISSHDYYSLPLVPITALAIAPLAADFYRTINDRLAQSRILRLVSAALFLFALLGAFWTIRTNMSLNNFTSQVELNQQIGEALNHQPGVIAVITDYGYPLEYYGWQNNDPWPLSADLKTKYFPTVFTRLAGHKSYFLITDFDEFDRQPQLKKYLYDQYPVLLQGKGYLVFDLLHPLGSVRK